jgi:hypothetical protein
VAAAAQSADKQTVQRNRSDSNSSSKPTKGDVATSTTTEIQKSNTATLHLTPYLRIAEMLVSIICNNELNEEVKSSLHNIIKVAREANSLEQGKGIQAEEQLKVSDICNTIYADLGELHNVLMPQIMQAQKAVRLYFKAQAHCTRSCWKQKQTPKS